MSDYTEALRLQAKALREQATALDAQAEIIEKRAARNLEHGTYAHAFEPSTLTAKERAKAPTSVGRRSSVQRCTHCGLVRSGPHPWFFFAGGVWSKAKPACPRRANP